MVSDRPVRCAGTGRSDAEIASWRTPLGESGILEFVLEAIKEAGSSMGVKTHSLRLIGNSVADTGWMLIPHRQPPR